MRVYNPFAIRNPDMVPMVVYPFEDVREIIPRRDALISCIDYKIYPTVSDEIPIDTEFGILFPWILDGKLVCDTHWYHGFGENWQDTNPEITDLPFRNNKLSRDRNASCETNIIVRGLEAQKRRKISNLSDYLLAINLDKYEPSDIFKGEDF